jgi:hypothetical protein
VTVFDGTVGRRIDWSGTPRVLEIEDLEEQQIVWWIVSGRWLADDGPVLIRLRDGGRDGDICVDLKLREGIVEAQLLLDPVTRLPRVLRRS